MPITINEPIILTETQEKKFSSLIISRDAADKLSARVTFQILAQDGSLVKEQTLEYVDQAYNDFWTAFNTGTYLYQELMGKDATLPDNLEADFVNPEPSQPLPGPEL